MTIRKNYILNIGAKPIEHYKKLACELLDACIDGPIKSYSLDFHVEGNAANPDAAQVAYDLKIERYFEEVKNDSTN